MRDIRKFYQYFPLDIFQFYPTLRLRVQFELDVKESTLLHQYQVIWMIFS